MNQPVTASQLYSHLACPHRVAMDVIGDPAGRDAVSPFVQLLWDRDIAHERALVAALPQPFLDLSALQGDEKEAATREAVARREPLIYSARLSVHGLLGEPDLLRLEGGGYVAIDIKSAAGLADDDGDDGQLGRCHGVQLALYTDILEQMGLSPGRHGYILDVHHAEVRHDLGTALGPRSPCLWETYLKTRQAVRDALARPQQSQPALSSACRHCAWRSSCYRQLRHAGDLTLLPELGRATRDVLQDEFPSIETLALADIAPYVDGGRTAFAQIGADTLRRYQRRAALAVAPGQGPYLNHAVDWPVAAMEIFLDIETDPMRDLCYLHGLLIRERNAGGVVSERFESLFAQAATASAERDVFAAAMALFRRNPHALILHNSKYGRTGYRRLAARYPEVADAAEVEALFAQPRALDLYFDAVKPHSEWPVHDYSIQSIAKYCGFRWRDADPSGAASVEWFDAWATGGDMALRQRLLNYNEDDCTALRVVWDRLRQLPVQTSS